MANPFDYLLPAATALAPPLINAGIQSGAISNASNNLQQGATAASNTITSNGQRLQDVINQNTGSQQQLLAPYITAGNANASMLNSGLAPGGGLADPYGKTFSFTGADLPNSPGYQFSLNQGQKAIDAARAAMGTKFSGGAVKAADQYATDYAGTKFNDAFNQAQSTFNTNANQFETDQANRYNRLQAATQTGLAATDAGVNVLGQNTNASVSNGNFTAAALADLQQQLAIAKATGNIGQANNLSNAIAQGLQGLKASGLLPGNSGPGANGLTPQQSGNIYDVPSNPGQLAPGAIGPPATPADFGSAITRADMAAAPALAAAPELAAGGSTLAAGGGDALAQIGSAAPELGAAGATAAGVGGGAALAAPGADAAAAAAAGTTGSTGALASIGGLLTNPITIGIGAAIAGALIWRSTQVHQTANKWTQNTQTQFGQHLGTIVDAFDKAYSSGQLSKADAQQAYQQTASLISDVEQKAADFQKANGGKGKTVIDQFHAEMTKDFGPGYQGILGKMAAEVNSLPAV